MTSTKYARQTTVSVENSRAEIETLITRFGATTFGYMSDQFGSKIVFEIGGLRYAFSVPSATRDEAMEEFPKTAPSEGVDRLNRIRWRALVLIVKAKLVAVDDGITTFEREFMPNLLLPSGETLEDRIMPEIREASRSGRLPDLTLLAIGK